MSEKKIIEFEDYKDTMPLNDIYAFAKYGFNARRAFKNVGINPDKFMEMIICKKP